MQEQSPWISKTFMPLTSHYLNPRITFEQKVAIFASLIAPTPRTYADMENLNSRIKEFADAITDVNSVSIEGEK